MSGASWPRAVFERIHAASSDPWGVGSRPYERDKYRRTLALLAGQRFHHALELGCSIGVMTALLAWQCDHLLAVDVAEAALAQARRRCAGLKGVTFYRGQLPDGFPDLPAASCDLIIISELLYFLSLSLIPISCSMAAISSISRSFLFNFSSSPNVACYVHDNFLLVVYILLILL